MRSRCTSWTRTCSAPQRSWASTSAATSAARTRKTSGAPQRGASPNGSGREHLRPAAHRPRHRRFHPRLVQRRGQEARDDQLPHAAPREGRALLREDLRPHQGLGVLLRQVQAGALQGHHLRALRRGGHPVQGAARPHGAHRAGRARGAHLVPAGHTFVARLPAHGHRAPRGAQGQAAREGHLLRGEPGHLGRRGEAACRPAVARERDGRGDRGHREEARPRHRPPLQGARGRAEAARGRGRQGRRDPGTPARRREGDPVRPRAGPGGHRDRPAVPGRVPEPARPQDHRGRDALARAAAALRRVLRGRHGRGVHPQAHRPHRPRRGRDQAARHDRRQGRPPAVVGPAAPEDDQAAEDRDRLQPA